MYAYINGIVAEKSDGSVVLDVGGVGYALSVSTNTADACAVGEKKLLYTHLGVKEDEMSLYGFADKSEKNLFLQLISVSGIGPKLAMSILGGMRLGELKRSIASGNSAALNGIKGVGKKTAERIVIDLKDKIDADFTETEARKEVAVPTGKAAEAVAVLTALGIKSEVAERSVAAVYDEGLTVNQIVHKALGG